ncbi:MAG TPA: ubiquitin-conjugating enzyme E2 [Blastocatellia bacterium]|jgi:ubiquitin-protein ligase|nr:ubiquitin-conjugating enzyme E2 [Blastocatellia bacterium]
MQARLRRLTADHERVASLFGSTHRYIRLVQAEGTPPDRYIFEFRINSLVPTDGDQIAIGHSHRAEIFLPLDYPRRPPFCRMLSPVFHPNIDPQKICIGDHWSAGQSLAQLIARIGEMLCYQSYNVKSPLNAKAAAWAEANIGQLPLQRMDLIAGL